MTLENKTEFILFLGKKYEEAAANNQPVRKRLIAELIHNFSYSADNISPKGEIVISLNGRYSHKIVKSTLHQVGYTPTSKRPNLKNFKVKPL